MILDMFSRGEFIDSGFCLKIFRFVVYILLFCSVVISVFLLIIGLCLVLIKMVDDFILVNCVVLNRCCVFVVSGRIM